MTNAKKDWLDEFKKSLADAGWLKVVTSKDLVFDDDQTGVNMAIDMDIGRRAAVFIGNGVRLALLRPAISLLTFPGVSGHLLRAM